MRSGAGDSTHADFLVAGSLDRLTLDEHLNGYVLDIPRDRD